jgi:hypothetical protein
MMKISHFFCLTVLSFLFVTYGNAQQFSQIQHINSSIIVDGTAEPVWNDVKANPITFFIDGIGYPDSADCSGYYKAFWNSDTLYVLIFAVDDSLYTNDPTVYYNDGFEIYLDMENSKVQEYTNTCYQFRFIPGSNDITGRWGLDVWTPPTVDFAIAVDSLKDRTLEAVFPLISLGKVNSAVDGDEMGFEVEILDNDGEGRNHVLSWNKNEHLAWQNPSKMGTIQLVEMLSNIENNYLQDISVYPNPAGDLIIVSSKTNIKNISIFSMSGHEVLSRSKVNSGSTQLDLSNIQTGLYLLRVAQENGMVSNTKIIRIAE